MTVYINWKKDLPDNGFLGHVKSQLRSLSFNGQVSVEFKDQVSNVGCSYDDRTRKDVYAYDDNGDCGGWSGSYGGSYASMYSNSTPAQAAAGKVNVELPPNKAILEVHNYYKGRSARITINPTHKANMLPSGEKLSDRLVSVLAPFKRYKASYRKEYLASMDATTEELQTLVDKGFLKCHKGKQIQRTGKYSYDLAGAKITPEGKTTVENN